MSLSVFLLVLIAAICHAGWNFVARKTSGDVVIIWLAIFTGFLIIFPVEIAAKLHYGFTHAIPLSALGYLVATGVIHSIYFFLLTRAYEQSEMSLVYPTARGFSIGLTVVFALYYLEEEISFYGLIGIGLILLGVVSMGIHAFNTEKECLGYRCALYIGTSIAAYSLIDKIGVTLVDPVLYICVMYFLIIVILSPLVVWRHRGTILKTARNHIFYILVIGTGSIGAYLMILFALTISQVSYIVAVREFAVVVGTLLGVIFLKERLTALKVIAVITIVIGLICIKLGW